MLTLLLPRVTLLYATLRLPLDAAYAPPRRYGAGAVDAAMIMPPCYIMLPCFDIRVERHADMLPPIR